MTLEQKSGFELIVKLLGVTGAFLSALGGIYLAVDSVKDAATEVFRTAVTYIPGLIVIPTSYFILLYADRDLALLPQIFFSTLLGSDICFIIAVARLTIFWNEERAAQADSRPDKKLGWVILVFGFNLLLIQQIVDLFIYIQGK